MIGRGAPQHRLRQLLLRLLASAGRCITKRMFGGYALSTDGLTIAILADLGDGEKLWLKGDASTRRRYEAALGDAGAAGGDRNSCLGQCLQCRVLTENSGTELGKTGKNWEKDSVWPDLNSC